VVVPLALAGPVGNLIFYPPLRVGIGALEGGAHPLIAGVDVARPIRSVTPVTWSCSWMRSLAETITGLLPVAVSA